MAKHRSYPIEFKRQVAQEYLAGETSHGLAKRHEVSRNLVRMLPDQSTTIRVEPSSTDDSRRRGALPGTDIS
jgi:transposase-like protein